MIKYGVWLIDSEAWCGGNPPFVSNIDGYYNFCTYDINLAFQYRENIANRNKGLSYEVRER